MSGLVRMYALGCVTIQQENGIGLSQPGGLLARVFLQPNRNDLNALSRVAGVVTLHSRIRAPKYHRPVAPAPPPSAHRRIRSEAVKWVSPLKGSLRHEPNAVILRLSGLSFFVFTCHPASRGQVARDAAISISAGTVSRAAPQCKFDGLLTVTFPSRL